MKKLLYTLLAVSIIFSACEEEDIASTTPAPTHPLVGIWILDSIYEEELDSMVYPPNSSVAPRMEFLQSGEYKYYEQGTQLWPTTNCTWEVFVGQTEEFIQFDCDGENWVHSYKIFGNSLHLGYGVVGAPAYIYLSRL